MDDDQSIHEAVMLCGGPADGVLTLVAGRPMCIIVPYQPSPRVRWVFDAEPAPRAAMFLQLHYVRSADHEDGFRRYLLAV